MHSYPSTEMGAMGERGAIFLDDCISRTWEPSSYKQHSWVSKQARDFKNILHL